MRFLLDQSADARLIPFLTALGHAATRIATHYPGGLPDEEVLALAWREHRILITNDRDFGELVFRQHRPHAGVIYFRLRTTALGVKLERLRYVLEHHADQLTRFLVVTENRVRIAIPPQSRAAVRLQTKFCKFRFEFTGLSKFLNLNYFAILQSAHCRRNLTSK